MSATYVQRGDRIDHTPSSAVSAGDIVVQGSLVGIATEDLEANKKGSLAVEGVFDIDKENVAFSVGDDVYYDEEHGLAFAGQGVYLGKCVAAAAADDDTVKVKLVPQEAAVSGTATGTGTGA